MIVSKSEPTLSTGRSVLIPMVALCLAVLAPALALAAGGKPSPAPPPTTPKSMTPEQHYNQGLKYRDQAWELERKAASATGRAAGKLLEKAHKEYENAVDELRRAVAGAPLLYQAHGSLGYALRKIGEYDESIAAYDRALSLSPDYTEAIEYRAEAYLGRNRLEEAKEAYMILMRQDQARADELMTAMKKWLERQRSGASDVSASDLEAFASWVEERASIMGHAAMVPAPGARDWRDRPQTRRPAVAPTRPATR